jgi:hypothetical protein
MSLKSINAQQARGMIIKVFLQKISSCTVNFYLGFKNPVFKAKVISQNFVKIVKIQKFFESQHAALVPFAKIPQKLSLQKFSRKSISSTNFRTKGNHKVSSI